MTDEHTPTTEQVLDAYCAGLIGITRSISKYKVLEDQFNCWLAEVERAAAYQARQELIDACYDASTHLFGGQEYVSTAILESEAKRLGESEARND
jgi:hypothetical protein